MPTGRVRFFDPERGFGFITGDDGSQVFLHSSALPAGGAHPRAGARVEYSVADGRKGPRRCRCGSWPRRPQSPMPSGASPGPWSRSWRT